jgi:pilus assembly protein CpaB
MNFKRMAIALAIGLFISGSCTYLLSRTLHAKAAVKEAELMYVTPAHSMQAGEILKADSVQLVKWPASQPVADAFTKPDAVIGRALIYPIAQGQLLTDKFLSTPGSGMGLAGEIPDGMRAIALRSDEVVGVAGFVIPGSHVDVLATIHTDTHPEPTTFTVVQNAQVLAAGHQIQPDPDGKPVPVNVVTLLLSPDDAQRAVLASQQGTIHFILRSGSDTQEADSAPVQVSQLMSGDVKPAPVHSHYSAPSLPAPAPTLSVQTISGDKQSTDTFRMVTR